MTTKATRSDMGAPCAVWRAAVAILCGALLGAGAASAANKVSYCKDATSCAKACDSGGSGAVDCWRAGALLDDPAERARRYEIGCTARDQRSCAALGAALRDGMGIAKDEKRGVQLILKACTAGKVGRACEDLAWDAWMKDRAKFQGYDLAVMAYEEGCLNGWSGDCDGASFVLRAGPVQIQDLDKAARFFRRALEENERHCEAGAADQCFDLGRTLRQGALDWARSPDPKAGDGWLAKGCRLGSADACRAREQAVVLLPASGSHASLPRPPRGVRWQTGPGTVDQDGVAIDTLTARLGSKTVVALDVARHPAGSTCRTLREGIGGADLTGAGPWLWVVHSKQGGHTTIVACREHVGSASIVTVRGPEPAAALWTAWGPAASAAGSPARTWPRPGSTHPKVAGRLHGTVTLTRTGGLRLETPDDGLGWQLRESKDGRDVLALAAPAASHMRLEIALEPAPTGGCGAVRRRALEGWSPDTQRIARKVSTLPEGWKPEAVAFGRDTSDVLLCADVPAGVLRVRAELEVADPGTLSLMLSALLQGARALPERPATHRVALADAGIELEVPSHWQRPAGGAKADTLEWPMAWSDVPRVRLEVLVPASGAAKSVTTCQRYLKYDIEVVTGLPPGWDPRATVAFGHGPVRACADLGGLLVVANINNVKKQHGMSVVGPVLASARKAAEARATAVPASLLKLPGAGLTVTRPKDGFGWQVARSLLPAYTDQLTGARPGAPAMLSVSRPQKPEPQECKALIAKAMGELKKQGAAVQFTGGAPPGWHDQVGVAKHAGTEVAFWCADQSHGSPILVSAPLGPGKAASSDLQPMLAALRIADGSLPRAVVEKKDPPVKAKPKTGTTASSRKRGRGVGNVTVALGVVNAADPERVGDTEWLVSIVQRGRVAIGGRRGGYLLGLDLELGSGSNGGFVYELNLHLLGAALTPMRGVAIGLVLGGGLSGVADGRVPFTFQAPLELYAAANIAGLATIYGAYRINILHADERESGSPSALFGDETVVYGGLSIGLTGDENEPSGIDLGVTYREQMGTSFLGGYIGYGLAGRGGE